MPTEPKLRRASDNTSYWPMRANIEPHRTLLAYEYARKHDVEYIHHRILNAWGSDTLGFVATLEPYHGPVMIAILHGTVEPCL